MIQKNAWAWATIIFVSFPNFLTKNDVSLNDYYLTLWKYRHVGTVKLNKEILYYKTKLIMCLITIRAACKLYATLFTNALTFIKLYCSVNIHNSTLLCL